MAHEYPVRPYLFAGACFLALALGNAVANGIPLVSLFSLPSGGFLGAGLHRLRRPEHAAPPAAP